MSDEVVAKGGCLCGAVRYEVRGALRDAVACHCGQCLRWHGHHASYTAVDKDELHMPDTSALRWFASSAAARRGFCAHCGSSLFWDRLDSPYLSVAAGSLDQPSGLTTARHIFVGEKADYYELTDGLPQLPRGMADQWSGGASDEGTN